jgi:hypothetical protein
MCMGLKVRCKERVGVDYAYHGRIEKRIVEVGISSQQLATQIFRVLDVFEEGDLHRIGLIVRQREGPYRGHGAAAVAGWLLIVQNYLFPTRLCPAVQCFVPWFWLSCLVLGQ